MFYDLFVCKTKSDVIAGLHSNYVIFLPPHIIDGPVGFCKKTERKTTVGFLWPAVCEEEQCDTFVLLLLSLPCIIILCIRSWRRIFVYVSILFYPVYVQLISCTASYAYSTETYLHKFERKHYCNCNNETKEYYTSKLICTTPFV